MKPFSDKDFLLTTQTAKTLFQSVAGLPVIDFFTQQNPKIIAENRRFENITEFLIDQDPKKQQAMRTHGIDEYYITGESGAYERFQKWAETLPCLIGNPLYHSTHLELQRYFSVFDPLSPATAEKIWNTANQKIAQENFTVFEILKRFHIKSLHIPQNPADSLWDYQAIRDDGGCPAEVSPVFCADAPLSANAPSFPEWLTQLEESCSTSISTLSELQSCLVERLLFFKSMGAKSAVQTLVLPELRESSYEKADSAFQKAKKGLPLSQEEQWEYQGFLLRFLTKKYQDYGFTMGIRIQGEQITRSVISLLEQVNKEHKLPKTLITITDPSQYPTLVRAVVSSEISGFIKLFCDGMLYRKEDLLLVLKAVAENGILPDFIGLSSGGDGLLSYPSQEYFRRLVCEFFGSLAEAGEYPAYLDLLKKFAGNIAYENTAQYF